MKRILLSLSIVGTTLSGLAQAVWTVDNNTDAGAQFSTLQSAIDAASPGDILYVHPSPVTYGNFTINKTIHIRGLGHFPELNNGEIADCGIITVNAPDGAPNCSISGIQFKYITATGGQDYNGMQLINNRVTEYIGSGAAGSCENWLIQGNTITANSTQVIDGNYNNNWMVVNNYIQNASTTFKIFQELNSSTEVRNNIIMSNLNNASPSIYINCDFVMENCILLFTQAAATTVTGTTSTISYTNCLLYNYSGTTMTDLEGVNNLNNVNPMFSNDGGDAWFGYGDDYVLDQSSLAFEYGTDGDDLGVFGNSMDFSMEGYPLDLPYPTDMLISTTQVNNGGTLEVNFKAKGN